MQRAIGNLVIVALIVCSIGCAKSPQPQEQRNPDAPSNDKTAESSISIEPGVYSDGPEYERLTKLLAGANAKVGLDPHQGIEWYDHSSDSWKTIDRIEGLEPLLNAVTEKNLVTVSTGKAMWGKYDEYIDVINKYAKASGYATTIVTDAHSSATIVSKVVHHND